MIDFESRIKYLKRFPLLLLDGNSALAKQFVSEVRKVYTTITIDLAKVSTDYLFSQCLGADKDTLPIFLIPNDIKDNEIGVFVKDILKRDQLYYKREEVDINRFLAVMEGKSMDDLPECYRPHGMPAIYTYRILNNKQ